MTFKKLEGLFMKILLFISYQFSEKLTCITWIQIIVKTLEVNILQVHGIHLQETKISST